MFPTPLAIDLAAKLDFWMAETEALMAPGDAGFREREARVVITANDYTEVALLPPVLKKINELAPRVTVVLRSVEAYPLDSHDFLEGRVHFALAGVEPPPGPFDAAPLFDEHFVLIARHGHPAIGSGFSLEHYIGLQHALVSPQGQGIRGPVDDSLAGLGVARRIALSLTRFTSLPYLLSSTDMVATVPSRFAEMPDVRRNCDRVELPFESPTFTLSLIWHRRHRNDPLHRWIRELVVAELGAPSRRR